MKSEANTNISPEVACMYWEADAIIDALQEAFEPAEMTERAKKRAYGFLMALKRINDALGELSNAH